MRSIHKLINFLMEKWIKLISESEKIKEIITKYLLVYNIMLEFEGKKLSSEQVESWSNIKSERYMRDMIENFVEGKNWTYEVIKINSCIWKSVISAMLFNIPKETTIRLRESILKDYLPKVYDDLIIQFNELTIMTDFTLIEQKIKRVQRRYAKKYNYTNSRRAKKLAENNV